MSFTLITNPPNYFYPHYNKIDYFLHIFVLTNIHIMTTTLQRFKQTHDDYDLAERYYTVLSALNNLKLTEREIQLVAFTAIKGSISYANVREEFCKRFSTSSPTINNIISKLKKLYILTKINGKIKVNPIIQLNFKNDVKLEISLIHRQTTESVSEKLSN